MMLRSILNVIFPAFLIPAIQALVMPLLGIIVLAVEGCVYYINCRHVDEEFR
jgi:hypothetical protein